MQVVSQQLGLDLHISERILTLLTLAEAYQCLGYSVIPLLGNLDPARPKTPAVPWSRFQQAHASLYEYNQWFSESQFAGIGIVTGHISKLVVLDFDSEDVFKDFRARHPELTDTHTVRSAGRQLPHLYFKLPDHLHIESMKGQGIDVLSNGRYVVAPPTSIDGQDYKIVRGGMPKALTERDIRRIQAFLAHLRTDGSQSLQKVPINTLKTVLKVSEPSKVTSNALVRLYNSHCQKMGRNDALFQTTLFARDTGWTPTETYACLSLLHTQQAAAHSHSRETVSQRQQEALATIQSAFSKSARTIRKAYDQGLLSNTAREILMQHGMTYVIRTYEGLLHKGIKPGQMLTARESIEHLKGLVGRDSVWNALKAVVNGKRLFGLPVSPTYTVATDPNQNESDKMLSEVRKNQDKPLGGRPNHRFRMPTNDELCELLGVNHSGSDVLQAEDLTSASKTRMALHRELIKRRPGQYPLGWLARRLGVNRRTIASYNSLIPINSKPMHIETPVNWSNIERLLPMDEPIQGARLIGKGDKCYPALRSIASRLLARGEGIILKQQTVNLYWYGDTEPPPNALLNQPKLASVPIAKDRRSIMIPQEKIQTPQQPASKKGRAVKMKQAIAHPNFRRPLRDTSQEVLAQKLYIEFNKQLSISNARCLVFDYDSGAIATSLKLLTQRKTINPVGFFVTTLRSITKIGQN